MTVTFSAVRKFPCHNVTKITPKKKSCDNGGYLLGHNHHIASMGQQEKKKLDYDQYVKVSHFQNQTTHI